MQKSNFDYKEKIGRIKAWCLQLVQSESKSDSDMSKLKNGRYEEAGGAVRWYLNGKIHREDGPAVEHTNGTKIWFINGTYHREDGPAFETASGSKEWYLNGQRHREDGPAIDDGDFKDWYLRDQKLSEEEFNQWLEKKNLNENLQSSLDPKSTEKKNKI